MGQNLFLQWLLLCFIKHVRLYLVYMYCHILLINLRQLAVFINVSNFYQILGLLVPDKQFFYFVSFLILLLFIVTLLLTNVLNFPSLMYHTSEAIKSFICMLTVNSAMIIFMSCNIVAYGTF